RAADRRAATFQTDLSRPDAAAVLVQSVVDTFGRLDVLINMASVYVQRPFTDLTAADWDAVVDIDLRAAFLCAHAAVPHMRAQGGGRIINFSDWIAKSGRPRYVGYLLYYFAKAGVGALTGAVATSAAGGDRERGGGRGGAARGRGVGSDRRGGAGGGGGGRVRWDG